MATVVSQVAVNQEKPVDREKTCPLLLRVFCANGRHNPISDYMRGGVPANELQMYTWMDCTLRELTSLIKEVNPDARRRGTTFDFSIVAPDRMNNRYTIRDIGNTMNGQRGVDDGKSLAMCKFEIGDFIDVAITMPGVGPASVRRYGSYGGGMRRNGDDFDRERRRFSPVRDRY
ncbi:unnamed protein product [Angiostrongylus costaricensis]|uniref:18 kDa Sin3-associated polypeptide n=1 Tax=Angiostrongylus costaricensis TaxID=334426 RepID=A0A0R3PJL0_ANGCS|nr:unnamed protein product [Angiostrongylus costaricensis]